MKRAILQTILSVEWLFATLARTVLILGMITILLGMVIMSQGCTATTSQQAATVEHLTNVLGTSGRVGGAMLRCAAAIMDAFKPPSASETDAPSVPK
jgi:hypothetical protein